MNKNSSLNFDYKQHNLKFSRENNEIAFKLEIDSFPYDIFTNKKMQNNAKTNNNKNNKYYNFSYNNNAISERSFNNILVEKKNIDNKPQKRTGSDIYKSTESLNYNDKNTNTIEKEIKNSRIKNTNISGIEEINNKKDNIKNISNSNNYDVLKKKKDENFRSGLQSLYISEIQEGEIPVYEYINEKIINADSEWI